MERSKNMPKLTADDREMYAEFTSDFPYCMACGIPDGTRDKTIDYPRHLERAHIIGGAGRVADREDIWMACKLCHDVSHGARIVVAGKPLPKLRLEHVLWLKRVLDNDHWNRRYLATLAGRKTLPDIVPPPLWYQHQFARWHGIKHREWARKR